MVLPELNARSTFKEIRPRPSLIGRLGGSETSVPRFIASSDVCRHRRRFYSGFLIWLAQRSAAVIRTSVRPASINRP